MNWVTPKVIFESFLIGSLSSILVILVYLYIINYRAKEKHLDNKIKKLAKIYFFIGVVVHLIISYFGIEDWQCDRQCMVKVNNIIG